ncbi:MAG: TetR/AcrR family transcriptional regulator [Nocardioides sp.]|nr:TetR/AcrR family transcriptional regulator [Nocardioides sp.]
MRNRAKILDTARESFARDGVGVPLDTIAERAGVGPGTVHRHFPTKAVLVAAVIADRFDHLVQRATQLGEDPTDDFFTFLTEVVESARDNLVLASALDGGLGRDGEASSVRLVEAFGTLFAAAQRSGGVRDDVTAEDVHAVVSGAVATENRLAVDRRGLGLEIAIAGLRLSKMSGSQR